MSISILFLSHSISVPLTVVSAVCRFVRQTWTQTVCAALKPFSIPSVPPAFREAIDSGRVRESMQAGTCPRWTSTSPTTLRVCSLAYGPGVDRRGCPPHPSPTQHVVEQGVAASPGRLAFAPGLPAVLGKEAAMQLRAAVVICIGLVVTD